MILDDDLILYNLEYPIKKSFWVVDNYSEMKPDYCRYLQEHDMMNGQKTSTNDKKEKEIKSKQIRGFQIISFSYLRINFYEL